MPDAGAPAGVDVGDVVSPDAEQVVLQRGALDGRPAYAVKVLDESAVTDRPDVIERAAPDGVECARAMLVPQHEADHVAVEDDAGLRAAVAVRSADGPDVFGLAAPDRAQVVAGGRH